jgi:hypothetical protein
MSELTLQDIKRALELLEENNPFPCTCELAKEYCGICRRHGLLFINEEQRDLIKRIL